MVPGAAHANVNRTCPGQCGVASRVDWWGASAGEARLVARIGPVKCQVAKRPAATATDLRYMPPDLYVLVARIVQLRVN
jgi:hypothetical protein